MSNKKTYWLYLWKKPIQAVRLTEGATDCEVKIKAEKELESVPGVICNEGENPGERRLKIWHSEIRVFDH